MSVLPNEPEGTLHLVSNQGPKAAALGGRRVAGVAAAAVVTVALAGCTNTEAADQQVIDRLSTLEVMTVPPGTVELSRTSTKGGGNSVIRNASSVILVYATTQSPVEVGKDVHARFDSTWHFKDNGAVPLGGWRASGSPGTDPGTTADVLARRVTSADKAPPGSNAVVTVSVSATRPR
jgi:hypothetical protein